MREQNKEVFDALLSGNKELDSAFRLYVAAKYLAEDKGVQMEILGFERDLIDVEQRVISLMMRLNNEI